MPNELKLIVMPPEKRWKRPASSWRNPGRDTVAERRARDLMVAHAAQFVCAVAGGTALWTAVCLAVDVAVKAVG
ncbi:hypothetical protein AALA69_03120 [Eggerthellaceae bacterium 24-137]